MRLLDLFCGAGGAGVGYSRAGFDVLGVDLAPQSDYPFPFAQADALAPPVDLAGFDLIHASPPCQAYTTMTNRRDRRSASPPLIAETRAMLEASGVPYVIENVPGARVELREPVIGLEGAMFGLGVARLRLFELGGWFTLAPLGGPGYSGRVVGVYGRHPDGREIWGPSGLRAAASLEEGKAAMGIDWVTEWRGLAEAIPPAYTEWLGRAFADQYASASIQGIANRAKDVAPPPAPQHAPR